MSKEYKKVLTITIDEGIATSLVVGLTNQLARYESEGFTIADAHPDSCIGKLRMMLHELTRVSLNDKSQPHVKWHMERVAA